MISKSLQDDLYLAKQLERCRNQGGCIYGRPFIRGRFYKTKCKRCRQEIVLIESELEKYGGLK